MSGAGFVVNVRFEQVSHEQAAEKNFKSKQNYTVVFPAKSGSAKISNHAAVGRQLRDLRPANRQQHNRLHASFHQGTAGWKATKLAIGWLAG